MWKSHDDVGSFVKPAVTKDCKRNSDQHIGDGIAAHSQSYTEQWTHAPDMIAFMRTANRNQSRPREEQKNGYMFSLHGRYASPRFLQNTSTHYRNDRKILHPEMGHNNRKTHWEEL